MQKIHFFFEKYLELELLFASLVCEAEWWVVYSKNHLTLEVIINANELLHISVPFSLLHTANSKQKLEMTKLVLVFK